MYDDKQTPKFFLDQKLFEEKQTVTPPERCTQEYFRTYDSLDEIVNLIKAVQPEADTSNKPIIVLDADGVFIPKTAKRNQWESLIKQVFKEVCNQNTTECISRLKEQYNKLQDFLLQWAYGMADMSPISILEPQNELQETLRWVRELYTFFHKDYFESWREEFTNFFEAHPEVADYIYDQNKEKILCTKASYPNDRIEIQAVAQFATEQHIRNLIWALTTHSIALNAIESSEDRRNIYDYYRELVIQAGTHMWEENLSDDEKRLYKDFFATITNATQQHTPILINSFGIREVIEGYLTAATTSEKQETGRFHIFGPSIEDILYFLKAFQYHINGEKDNTPVSIIDKHPTKSPPLTVNDILSRAKQEFSPTHMPIAGSKAVVLFEHLKERCGDCLEYCTIIAVGDSQTIDGPFLTFVHKSEDGIGILLRQA